MSVVNIEDVNIQTLRPGDRLSAVVFGESSVSVKYGVYTGVGYTDIPPNDHDVRWFENGLWMWDIDRWIDISHCHITKETYEHLYDAMLPFTDFSNILKEEVEASECL